MKAVRYHHFGSPSVLGIEEIAPPVMNDDQLLIEVYATTVNSGDCHLRSGSPFLARVFAGPIVPRQKILGTTYSGKVVGTGANVHNFKIDDLVLGSLGIHSGSYCEYIVVNKDSAMIKKPDFVTHEEAASMIFGFLSAKYFLDQAQIASGKKVLIIGAAGAVGSHAVQYAVSMGAKVHGLCHVESMDFVYGLGASQNYDYKVDKLEHIKLEFDIILDTVGKEKLSVLVDHLSDQGIYMTTAARPDLMMKKALSKSFASHFKFDIAKSSAQALSELMTLVSKGQYEPTIDAIYSMDEVVKAHHYFEGFRKKGAVVLKIKK